jgi:hypothetical protein
MAGEIARIDLDVQAGDVEVVQVDGDVHDGAEQRPRGGPCAGLVPCLALRGVVCAS